MARNARLIAEEEKALDLHRKAIVVDGSSCPKPEKYFSRMKEGGVTASNVTGIPTDAGLNMAMRSTCDFHNWIDESPNEALFATKVEDIERAKTDGKVALILGPQNTKMIEDDLRLLKILHRLGVRILQLTYNEKNFVGDGCVEKTDSGLSKFGIKMVEEMNRLGVLIDLSHCGVRTTMDAIEASNDTVVFSHANPHSLCNNPRNKTDEQIKALAEKGGVIGITACSPFYDVEGKVHPSIEDLFKHVDYTVNLVGVDHVGFGLDINETETPENWPQYYRKYPEVVRGMPNVEKLWLRGLGNVTYFPEITKGLVKRGYSDAEILKLLGGNFLKVFRNVWRE